MVRSSQEQEEESHEVTRIQCLLATIAEQVTEVQNHEEGAHKLQAAAQETQQIEMAAMKAELVALSTRRDAAKSELTATVRAMRDANKLVGDTKKFCGTEAPLPAKPSKAQQEVAAAEAAGVAAAIRHKSSETEEVQEALVGLRVQVAEVSSHLEKRRSVAAGVVEAMRDEIASEEAQTKAAEAEAQREHAELAQRAAQLSGLLEAQKRLASLDESNAALRARVAAGAVAEKKASLRSAAATQREWLEGVVPGSGRGGGGKARRRKKKR